MSVAGVGKNFIGARGAILENFSDFSENLFPKNEIKSKNLVYGVENFFRVFFEKIASYNCNKNKIRGI